MREICASTSIRNPNAKIGNLKSLLRSRANGHLQILLFAVAPRKAWRRPARRSRGMNPQGGQLGHRASAEGAAHRGRTACAPRPRSAANVAVGANAWWAACATGVGSRDGAATDHMDAGKQQRCGAQLRRTVAAVQHQHAQDAAVGLETQRWGWNGRMPSRQIILAALERNGGSAIRTRSFSVWWSLA